MCGGDVFFQYTDINQKICTYASNDTVWEQYLMHGTLPKAGIRLGHDGMKIGPIQYPTQTKQNTDMDYGL